MIRFGVVGCRRGRALARTCAAVGGASVAAVYDVDRPQAEAVAAEIGAAVFHDLGPFLDSALDAVAVASPIPFHAAQVIAALERGLHVLSEVTACRTLDEAE